MSTAMKGVIQAFLICPLLFASAVDVQAQARFEVEPTAKIPRSYDSWSLFLVCNPAWLDQNGDDGIRTLFRQYKAFGETIGPDNLAVWFWKQPATVPSAELTDVSRSSEYCTRYKLLPSKSPFVLVTTRYPDEKEVGDYFFVSLNGLDASASAQALAKLNDQLLVTGLDQAGLDANGRWQRILAATVAAVSGAGSYFNKVSFSFNTGPFKAEITHSGQ